MGAGRLDKKILIRDFTRSKDSYKEPIQTWYTLATVWGSVEPLSGIEYWEAHKETAEVDTRIIIRYRKLLKPSQRLRYGNREFKIVSILCKNEDKKYTQIMCKEIVD